MKFAACLIKPLTAYYNWSGNRRKKHKEKQKEKAIKQAKKLLIREGILSESQLAS